MIYAIFLALFFSIFYALVYLLNQHTKRPSGSEKLREFCADCIDYSCANNGVYERGKNV